MRRIQDMSYGREFYYVSTFRDLLWDMREVVVEGDCCIADLTFQSPYIFQTGQPSFVIAVGDVEGMRKGLLDLTTGTVGEVSGVVRAFATFERGAVDRLDVYKQPWETEPGEWVCVRYPAPLAQVKGEEQDEQGLSHPAQAGTQAGQGA